MVADRNAEVPDQNFIMLDTPVGMIRRLRLEFKRATGFPVIWVAPDGTPLDGSRNSQPGRLEARAAAIHEALRWGEPCVMMDAGGAVTWAVRGWM